MDEQKITDPKERTKRSREMANAKAKAGKKGTTRKVSFATSRSCEAVQPDNQDSKDTDEPKSKRSRLYDKPMNKYSEEEMKNLTWSKPSKFVDRHLLSPTYAKKPLTHEELDLLIPEDLSDNIKVVDWVCHHFGEVKHERLLWKFRNKPKEYTRSFRERYDYYFKERREEMSSHFAKKRKAGDSESAITVTRPKRSKKANDRRRKKRVLASPAYSDAITPYSAMLPGAEPTGHTDEEPA